MIIFVVILECQKWKTVECSYSHWILNYKYTHNKTDTILFTKFQLGGKTTRQQSYAKPHQQNTVDLIVSSNISFHPWDLPLRRYNHYFVAYCLSISIGFFFWVTKDIPLNKNRTQHEFMHNHWKESEKKRLKIMHLCTYNDR